MFNTKVTIVLVQAMLLHIVISTHAMSLQALSIECFQKLFNQIVAL